MRRTEPYGCCHLNGVNDAGCGTLECGVIELELTVYLIAEDHLGGKREERICLQELELYKKKITTFIIAY